jgi:cytidylate kinase
MSVITISRELGSEGDQIADRICEALGYQRVDKDMVLHIAEEAGVDVDAVLATERNVTSRARLVSGAMTSLYAKQPTAFDRKTGVDDQTYTRVVHNTMKKFAKQGNAVIVGRGGQMILRDWPDALHVRLYADPEIRAQRIAQRHGISEQEAAQRITRSDERKRQYIRHMHNNADWKSIKYYHLAIDTGHIDPDVAVQIIILAARERAQE